MSVHKPVAKLLGILRQQKTLVQFGLSTALFQAARLITELITMAVVGPVLFGVWKLWQLLFIYAPILQLGIVNGANRNIPYFVGTKDNSYLRKTVATTVFSALFSSLTIGLTSFFVALYSRSIFMGVDLSFSLILSFSVAVAAWTLLQALINLLRSFEMFFSYSLLQLALASLLFLGIPICLNWGLNGYLVITAFAALLGIGLALFFLKSKLSFGFSKVIAFDLIKLGFPILIVGLAYSFFTTLDRVIIAYFLGPEEVGNYGLAIMVFGSLSLFPVTVSQFFYPKISKALGLTGSATEAFKIAQEQLRFALMITIASMLVLAISLPFAVNQFLPQYSAGLTAAYCLMPGLLGLSLVGGYANWLNSVKRQTVYLRVQVIAIVLSALLSIGFYLMGFGLSGIALGTSLAFIIYGILLRQAALNCLKSYL